MLFFLHVPSTLRCIYLKGNDFFFCTFALEKHPVYESIAKNNELTRNISC